MNEPKEVFLTTLNTDNYLPGVLVLAENIKRLCTHKLVVLATNDLKKETYQALEKMQIRVIVTEPLKIPEQVIERAQTSCFAHWPKTFFKLKIFDLTQFDKIVFLDSDLMLQENMDDLFEWKDMSATTAGKIIPGHEDWQGINSGLFVFEPKAGMADKLIGMIEEVAKDRISVGDQDVLNAYYPEWSRHQELCMPETYNVFLMYADYYKKNMGTPRVIHFIGARKPWMLDFAHLMVFYIKYTLTGRFYGIKMMMQYRKLLRRVI